MNPEYDIPYSQHTRQQRHELTEKNIMDDTHINTLRHPYRRRLRRFQHVGDTFDNTQLQHQKKTLPTHSLFFPSGSSPMNSRQTPSLRQPNTRHDRDMPSEHRLIPYGHIDDTNGTGLESFAELTDDETLLTPSKDIYLKPLSSRKNKHEHLSNVTTRPQWLNYISEASKLRDEDVPLIERAMEDIEAKARHYFLLFSQERKRRQTLEQTAYWFEQSNGELWKKLQDETMKAQELLGKVESLRGNPAMLKNIIERVDLLYTQLDTLVQSFTGVTCYLAYKEQTKDEALMTALDYLYPCRGLDPRLNALYGATYYYKLGLTKDKTSPPLPPPAVGYAPQGAGTPWLPSGNQRGILGPDNFPSQPTSNEVSKTSSLKKESPTTGVTKKPIQKQSLGQPTQPTQPTPVIRPTSTGVKKEPPDNKITLQGFQIFIETGKLTSSSNIDVVCVFRYDNESSVEAKKIPGRSFHETPVKNEIFSINELLDVKSLPPKISGVLPNYCLDVWLSTNMTEPMGTATRSFIDPETLTSNVAWIIKNSRNEPIGTLNVTIGSLPPSALLPAARFIEAKAGAPKKTPPSSPKIVIQQHEKTIEKKPTASLKLENASGGVKPPEPVKASSEKQTSVSAAAKMFEKGPAVALKPKQALDTTGKKMQLAPTKPPGDPSKKALEKIPEKVPIGKPGTLPVGKKPLVTTDPKKVAALTVKKPGELEMKKPGGNEIKKPGGIEIKKPGGIEVKKPGGIEIKKPGGIEIKKPGGIEIKKPGGIEMKKPIGVDIKKAGGPAPVVKKPIAAGMKKPGELIGEKRVEDLKTGKTLPPGGAKVLKLKDGEGKKPAGLQALGKKGLDKVKSDGKKPVMLQEKVSLKTPSSTDTKGPLAKKTIETTKDKAGSKKKGVLATPAGVKKLDGTVTKKDLGQQKTSTAKEDMNSPKRIDSKKKMSPAAPAPQKGSADPKTKKTTVPAKEDTSKASGKKFPKLQKGTKTTTKQKAIPVKGGKAVLPKGTQTSSKKAGETVLGDAKVKKASNVKGLQTTSTKASVANSKSITQEKSGISKLEKATSKKVEKSASTKEPIKSKTKEPFKVTKVGSPRTKEKQILKK